MRTARSLLFSALAFACGLGAPPSFSAEPATSSAISAAGLAALDPGAPTAPLHHQPLPNSGSIVDQTVDWKVANAAVAEFPHGHGDVLKWEKAQAQKQVQVQPAPSSADSPAPPEHHQHGGQR
ncbi:MAG: hypothetical protein LBJ15_03965 [Comamonas sp.]|jgi:hypothetical protein|uniref:hypothetical protein n=1 Tax=Comamonas sp. TaxID=34028 RepID=UPI002835F3E9|nr:hypothetical protein [Comamonas sp.]MDR0213144.1 hypothetical protein [Comamonas sp.]